MHEMLQTIRSCNYISEVLWYVCWIEINGNIEHLMLISQADWPEMHCDTLGDIMNIC